MSDKTSSFKIVAIDGGAATGKSSTARALAEQLDFMHVDTGAYYRTLTYALLREYADPLHTEKTSAILHTLTLGTQLNGNRAQLIINNTSIPDADIRSQEVNTTVSLFASQPDVRNFLFQYQRGQVNFAQENNFKGLIMEGRDIGSVIFPDADFRFFLFADASTRAKRRAAEGLTDSISERDALDASRKTAPLICPEGAVEIDTGPHTLDAVVAIIYKHINP